MLIRRQLGVTLIELMTLVMLIGILAAVAVPGTTQLLDSAQRRSEIHDLIGLFATARRGAVMSGQRHTLCPLTEDGACGSDWSRPVHVFRDPFNERRLTDNTNIVRVLPPPKRGKIKVNSSSGSYFRYSPNGTIRSDWGNITWCPDSADARHAAHLVISRGGRIRLSEKTSNGGVPLKSNGTPVIC